jgi:hypothetical protein
LRRATLTAGVIDYGYDADGWRIKEKTSTDTKYFMRGLHGELLTEVANPGTASVALKDYVYAGQRLLAVIVTP